jgi:hypothetical protein
MSDKDLAAGAEPAAPAAGALFGDDVPQAVTLSGRRFIELVLGDPGDLLAARDARAANGRS